NKSLTLVWEPPFSLLQRFFLPPIGLSSTGLLLAPTVSMTQPTVPANSSDASSPQDNAWSHLLALETQVQTTQTSLTLHTTELARLCQTMDTISHSLQMLLEHLPSTPVITPTPPTPPEMNSAPCFNVSAASHTKIPCPALPDTYDGEQAEGECFLQSCVTYIQLSSEAFASDALKISWVLSYMKLGHASTYAL
ncbi:hypothetical protein C0995_015200, partial [Termitomyces sp. Mi166